jgi:hypothetical protein
MKILVLIVFAGFVFAFGNCDPKPPIPPNPTPTPQAPHEVVIDKELMITSLDVVNSPDATSPDGAFAIKTLLNNMAPAGKDAKAMMLSLLTDWEINQTINSFSVPARANIRTAVINSWKAKDGQAAASDDDWNMNFANAPFRLLAIVNRIDLRRLDNSNVLNAGEGRFVFGVLDQNGNPMPFTIILEYEQQAKNEAELKKWATDWHQLGTFPAFNADYLNSLKNLTAKFTGKNVMPGKPNGSALNQLRTNEIAIGSPWELREFHLSAANGLFDPAMTMQTPNLTHNNKPRLVDFINQNVDAIKNGTHTVPQFFPAGQPFLAGNAPVEEGFWKTPTAIDGEARHRFSLNTCNACHSRETQTRFLHVENRAANQAAPLSGFLTGISVIDPVDNVTSRPFQDLADRAKILKFLIGEVSLSRDIEDVFKNRGKRVH